MSIAHFVIFIDARSFLFYPECMSVKVAYTGNDSSAFLSRDYLYNGQSFPQLSERSKAVDHDLVKGHVSYWLFDGVRMVYSDLAYREGHETSWKGEMDIVHLHFVLEGSADVSSRHTGRNYVISGLQHNIYYLGEVDMASRIQDPRSRIFMVQFRREDFLRLIAHSSDRLVRFGEKIAAGKTAFLSAANAAVNAQMQSVIHAILHCPYEGGIRKMFFLSKCMELLVLQSEAFDKAEGQPYVYCKTPYDRERIAFAKEYVIRHCQTPLTLSAVARAAGINEFKLKKGFREMYHTTVFGFLNDHKMELAKDALLLGQKNATELAYALGYSSLQHFSTAFKKKFGFPPSSLKP